MFTPNPSLSPEKDKVLVQVHDDEQEDEEEDFFVTWGSLRS